MTVQSKPSESEHCSHVTISCKAWTSDRKNVCKIEGTWNCGSNIPKFRRMHFSVCSTWLSVINKLTVHQRRLPLTSPLLNLHKIATKHSRLPLDHQRLREQHIIAWLIHAESVFQTFPIMTTVAGVTARRRFSGRTWYPSETAAAKRPRRSTRKKKSSKNTDGC